MQHRAWGKLKPLALSMHLSMMLIGSGVLFSATAYAENATSDYKVPAGQLSDALLSFALQAKVTLSADHQKIVGIRSAGLNGQYGIEQGFNALLEDSPYQIEKGQKAYTLVAKKRVAANKIDPQQAVANDREASANATTQAPTQLPTIVVNANTDPQPAYIVKTAQLFKGDAPLLETPRSVSVVGAEQIKVLAPKSIEQSLAYTAGVATDVSGTDIRMTGGGFIRGFSDGGAYYKDGLKQLSAGTYATWNNDIDEIDSVEVLKGPASVLYGQARPGGVVNVISKRPTADHVNALGVSYGRYERLQFNADLGGAIDDAEQFLYRLNVTQRNSDGQLIGARDDRFSISPAFTWNISDQTQLTLLGNYSEERGTPLTWWPSLYIYPEIKEMPIDRTAGDPSFDHFNRDTKSLGYALQHEMENGWKLIQNLRYSEIDVDYQHIYAQKLLEDKRSITRANLAQKTNGKTFSVDSRGEKELNWGELKHNLSVGVDYLKYKERGGLGFGWDVPNLDIYNPVYGQDIPVPELEANRTDVTQTGIYAINQLKLDHWVANISLRHDQAKTKQDSVTQPKINNNATTGSIGLLYLFDAGVAPYLSYATSFDPAVGMTADGTAFKPQEGTQYEIGIKYQPEDSDLLITASAFDIYQTNVATADPDHPTKQIQTGEVRSTGYELESKLKVSEQVNLMLSYTHINARTTKSNKPEEIGRRAYQTPEQMANIWIDYRPDFLEGFLIGAGARYKSKTPGTSSGQLFMNDARTLADLAIAYEQPQYRVALNISNLFDRKYYAGTFRGAAREANVSVKYYW